MANTSEIRNGLCIKHNNDVFSVVEFQHVKPGKGAAFVRTKMKSMTTGKVLDNTFPAGHKIDIVRVERRKFQFLYNDDMGYHFMDQETYEQTAIEEKMIDNPLLIKEGSNLTVELPQYVELKVTYTEPGERGNTATNAQKPAKLETGAEVRVPLFINEGDVVKIETKSNSYMERVKQ